MATDEKDIVTTKLVEYEVAVEVIEKIKSDLGAKTIEDLLNLNEQDLIECGMQKLPARSLLKNLSLSAAEAAASMSSMGASTALDNFLPEVPNDSSWLEALKAGGVLKVDQSSVISVVRAALAHRVGLFGIPEIIVTAMESFSEKSEEQVDPEYFKIRKELTRRNYADIFTAIDGLDGNYVTEARKKQLLERVDKILWPAITSFYGQLKSWQDSWMQGAANPALMMSAIMAASGGGKGVMPPGMMQPPDTGVLRDNADAVSDAVNKVFAGTGVQISAALAYEAAKIKDILVNTRLPALVGVANREQMLKQLKIAVPATYPRLEQNVTRFVLAILQVKDQSSGNEELQYFGSLFMLGSQIQWEQLGGLGGSRSVTGIGGKEL